MDTGEIRERLEWMDRGQALGNLRETLDEIDQLRSGIIKLPIHVHKQARDELIQRTKETCIMAALLEMVEIGVSWQDRIKVVNKMKAIDSVGGIE